MADSNTRNAAIAVTKLEGRGPLNLLGKETFLALKAELDRLDEDRSVRALILTGSGDRAFSAGSDRLQRGSFHVLAEGELELSLQ